MSVVGDPASRLGRADDPVVRLLTAEREARGRLREHPEIDGEGIRLALEHEWALMALHEARVRALPEPTARPPVGKELAPGPKPTISVFPAGRSA